VDISKKKKKKKKNLTPRGWLSGWIAWNFEYAPQSLRLKTQTASWGHWTRDSSLELTEVYLQETPYQAPCAPPGLVGAKLQIPGAK
jgi:hypothetical protein